MITYSDFQISRGVNALIILVPIFDNTSTITLAKFKQIEYMMEYKRKMPRIFDDEFYNTLLPRPTINSVFAHRTAGRSISGTGRLDYMAYTRCLHTIDDCQTCTLNREAFETFVHWYKDLNMSRSSIYIPYKLENMIDDNDWDFVLQTLIRNNVNYSSVNFDICKATKFNTRPETHIRIEENVFGF